MHLILKKKRSRIITGDFQVLHAVYIQPLINNPTLLARLHRTSSGLDIRWGVSSMLKKHSLFTYGMPRRSH